MLVSKRFIEMQLLGGQSPSEGSDTAQLLGGQSPSRKAMVLSLSPNSTDNRGRPCSPQASLPLLRLVSMLAFSGTPCVSSEAAMRLCAQSQESSRLYKTATPPSRLFTLHRFPIMTVQYPIRTLTMSSLERCRMIGARGRRRGDVRKLASQKSGSGSFLRGKGPDRDPP